MIPQQRDDFAVHFEVSAELNGGEVLYTTTKSTQLYTNLSGEDASAVLGDRRTDNTTCSRK